MARQFALPDIGSGLQEAEIVAWHVAVGDEVNADQVLCEVETEKSVVEIPVPFAGFVVALAGPVGTSVQVGEMLVVIGEESEIGTAPDADPASNEPALHELAQTPASPTAKAPAVPGAARPMAMPLVRKLARERGVDLAGVAGTGDGGRITRADVEAAADAAVRLGRASVIRASGDRSADRVPLSKLRRTIGAHMTRQWQQVPHITGHVDADASRLMAARSALSQKLGRRVPMDALLVAAVVPALKQFPVANAAIDGDVMVVRHYCDIGVAVGSPEGLLVPIVRDADRLDLETLVDRVVDLVDRARGRKLLPEEMGDQTFTISNLGSLRGQHVTQVIPAGTTGVVSFGRALDRPVVRDGAIVAAPVMAVSGTFDHRAMDGVEAMGVLNVIVDVMEEPTLLLLRGEER